MDKESLSIVQFLQSEGYTNTEIVDILQYGRKGMKWYQNIFTKGKKTTDPELAKTNKLLKKPRNELTDEELAKVNKRLKLEAEYSVFKKQADSNRVEVLKTIKSIADTTKSVIDASRSVNKMRVDIRDALKTTDSPKLTDNVKKVKTK